MCEKEVHNKKLSQPVQVLPCNCLAIPPSDGSTLALYGTLVKYVLEFDSDINKEIEIHTQTMSFGVHLHHRD
jgi:hypothetical protein